MAEIRFEGVSKRFGDVAVVSAIDLKIHDGEFFTFVGPSGCGKSTILNMIAGLEPVTEGGLFFGDTLVNELPPRQRDVAMVFQSYALYPHMTVYENIAFPLRMQKIRKNEIQEEVHRVAGILGLDALLQRKPKELSGGQRQRVALGRAIIRKPRVFLMDEPLSNLDARLRIDMRTELKRLHHQLRITTVYVTHDQEEAMSLSERIAVFYQGEIQQCGSPYEVYARPSNIFVGGFIGSPPMNIIPGSVVSGTPLEVDLNGRTFLLPAGELPVQKGVKAGIRPEDISVTGEKTAESVRVDIALIEPAGSFAWVDVIWNGLKVRGTAEAETRLKTGDSAFIQFPVTRIVLFDAESGRRL